MGEPDTAGDEMAEVFYAFTVASAPRELVTGGALETTVPGRFTLVYNRERFTCVPVTAPWITELVIYNGGPATCVPTAHLPTVSPAERWGPPPDFDMSMVRKVNTVVVGPRVRTTACTGRTS